MATLATDLSCSTLIRRDLHPLGWIKRFHCLIISSPLLRAFPNATKTGSSFEVTDGTKQVGRWNDGSNTLFPALDFSVDTSVPAVSRVTISGAGDVPRIQNHT